MQHVEQAKVIVCCCVAAAAVAAAAARSIQQWCRTDTVSGHLPGGCLHSKLRNTGSAAAAAAVLLQHHSCCLQRFA
jgi:hypothetical protein